MEQCLYLSPLDLQVQSSKSCLTNFFNVTHEGSGNGDFIPTVLVILRILLKELYWIKISGFKID